MWGKVLPCPSKEILLGFRSRRNFRMTRVPYKNQHFYELFNSDLWPFKIPLNCIISFLKATYFGAILTGYSSTFTLYHTLVKCPFYFIQRLMCCQLCFVLILKIQSINILTMWLCKLFLVNLNKIKELLKTCQLMTWDWYIWARKSVSLFKLYFFQKNHR